MPRPSSIIVASALLAIGATLPIASVDAHTESQAKHGGVVRHVAELDFELAVSRTDAVIYVSDHGKPYDTSKLSGTLTTSANASGRLDPAGPSQLRSKLVVAPGDRLTATINGIGSKPLTVRFTVQSVAP